MMTDRSVPPVHQLLKAPDLLLGLEEMLLEPLRHLRIVLVALDLALHELPGLLFESMRILRPVA